MITSRRRLRRFYDIQEKRRQGDKGGQADRLSSAAFKVEA